VLSIHREAGGHSTGYEDTCQAMEFVLREAGPGIRELQGLKEAATRLKAQIAAIKTDDSDRLAEAAVFYKGIEWALRYDTLAADDVALIKQALVRGSERAAALRAGQPTWSTKKGKLVRGFISEVDGSTQPYGVIVPHSYDGSRPMRLDVVLHGSSKPAGMSELKFIARFDEGDEDRSGPEADYIELHPLGRVENCYRWAGETDVLEAIEAACRNYSIDRDRIVLRGMSMGASGTWHLGLKHPGRFVAIGPYCGYVDTHRFSETPIPNFIKVGPLPVHQESGLHMLDSVDYAANAGVVPTIAAIGEKDVFFQAHVIMGDAFAKEGLPLVNLVSPGTGHVIDPVTHREQLRRIGQHVEKGLDRDPRQLRFVTWTLKYSRCHWLELLGLGRHYERAEFKAIVAADDLIEIAEVQNITRFAIHRPVARLRISGTEVPLPPHQPDDALVFSKSGDAWRCDGLRSQVTLSGKRPGLQGPIDDAFTTPFLCVRGTGQPWNPAVEDYCQASLQRFSDEWHHYFRGELPLKDDTAVTQQDVQTRNLILFGDPGSNPWIARALSRLPLKWSRETLQFGGQNYPAERCLPALIVPNPLDDDQRHYLVLNSGHTFHESELARLNYLLFPRWGDWAMVEVDPSGRNSQPLADKVLRAGYFDEQWGVPE
jgi:hypothetical protein